MATLEPKTDRETDAAQPTDQQQLFSTLLESEYDYTQPRRREIREATVISISETQVIVDLGVKRDGIVTSRDLDLLSEEYRNGLQVGDVVPVSVLDVSDRQEGIIVSLNKGLTQQDWLRAEKMLESKETCELEVTGVNRGGIVVGFGRLRGFVPNSHLTSVRRGLRGERLNEVKSELVGQTLSLAVIEVDSRRRRLVLSERVANRQSRKQLLEELTTGEVRDGVVRNIVDFGAFVDIGGVDGLIHVSELDWKRVNHPSEVLKVGDEIQVYVLSVDRERKRVGLSRKRLLPDPWPLVTEFLDEGEIVPGTITNVVDFGAFVDVGDGVEGLVHVSQIPGGDETRAHLEVGSSVRVRVLGVDPWRRRISLSLSQVPDQDLESDSEPPD
jgi:small subunit ribosomal protein S1